MPLNTLIALGANDNAPDFIAGEQGARFVVVSGKPINESIVQYGPFVMNTREEIEQAMRDDSRPMAVPGDDDEVPPGLTP